MMLTAKETMLCQISAADSLKNRRLAHGRLEITKGQKGKRQEKEQKYTSFIRKKYVRK